MATDNRKNYGEARYTALVPADNGRQHVVVFSDAPSGIRVISFRKANKREVKNHEPL